MSSKRQPATVTVVCSPSRPSELGRPDAPNLHNNDIQNQDDGSDAAQELVFHAEDLTMKCPAL
jgi:hypothetical protein